MSTAVPTLIARYDEAQANALIKEGGQIRDANPISPFPGAVEIKRVPQIGTRNTLGNNIATLTKSAQWNGHTALVTSSMTSEASVSGLSSHAIWDHVLHTHGVGNVFAQGTANGTSENSVIYNITGTSEEHVVIISNLEINTSVIKDGGLLASIQTFRASIGDSMLEGKWAPHNDMWTLKKRFYVGGTVVENTTEHQGYNQVFKVSSLEIWGTADPFLAKTEIVEAGTSAAATNLNITGGTKDTIHKYDSTVKLDFELNEL